MLTPYQYSPLNEEAGEIRLLTLLPGQEGDPAEILLETIPLTEVFTPKFEALSYAWGSTQNPGNIIIQSEHSLSVTSNLADALPYLRYEDRPRVLWIDAICVNQRDFGERASQVKRMADIYSKADRVVIWLGTGSEDSELAFDILRKIDINLEVDWQTSTFREKEGCSPRWADRTALFTFDNKAFGAVLNLQKRPWFSRLWVWQEVFLASEAVFMCGDKLLSCDLFYNAMFAFCLKPIPGSAPYRDGHRNISALRLFSFAKRKTRAGFIELVDQTKHSQCTDARDRVFALLSLAQECQGGLLIEPHYTKSASNIYRDVVVKYIKYTKTLRILSSVELHTHHTDMPSWVPDWSTPRLSEILSMHLVASNSQFNGEIEGSTLRAAGIHVGVVDHFENNSIPITIRVDEIIDEILRVAGALNLEDNTTISEFISAICSGLFAESFLPERAELPTLAQCVYSFHDFKSEPRNVSSDTIKFLNQALDVVSNRRVFTTGDGRICLGPRAVEVGDVVAVFLGCHTPLVLRPDGLRQFKLVGEAYCHGVMQGEALLGPLDNIWKQA
jgi:hypothetical protein